MPETNDLSCSFCGQRQKQVTKLVAGPDHAFICDHCVNRAHAVLADPGQTVATPIATIAAVSDAARTEGCSFCGKRRDQLAAMASAGQVRICDECLGLCDEVLSAEPLRSRRRDTESG